MPGMARSFRTALTGQSTVALSGIFDGEDFSVSRRTDEDAVFHRGFFCGAVHVLLKAHCSQIVQKHDGRIITGYSSSAFEAFLLYTWFQDVCRECWYDQCDRCTRNKTQHRQCLADCLLYYVVAVRTQLGGDSRHWRGFAADHAYIAGKTFSAISNEEIYPKNLAGNQYASSQCRMNTVR